MMGSKPIALPLGYTPSMSHILYPCPKTFLKAICSLSKYAILFVKNLFLIAIICFNIKQNTQKKWHENIFLKKCKNNWSSY